MSSHPLCLGAGSRAFADHAAVRGLGEGKDDHLKAEEAASLYINGKTKLDAHEEINAVIEEIVRQVA
jgi:hypothetical protein